MHNKALIIVDVQNDFLPGGALAVPDGDHVISVINDAQKQFDLVIATQDWHPANHGSFAANHPGNQPGDVVMLNGLTQILWPEHCVQGTKGAEFAEALDMTRVKRIFKKGTDAGIDSYSGLYDNGHKKDTGLGDFLKDEGVTDVYVAGLATDYCVKYTVLDARSLGFTVHVLKEGCRGVNLFPGDVQQAYRAMERVGAILE